MVDSENRVWLALGGSQANEARQWMVFDVQGKPLWMLSVPHEVRPLAARGAVVWASATDSDGAPLLIRFGVVHPI